MIIRALQENDDRRAVSRIYEESWKYAYRGIIPDEYLQSIPEGRWCNSLDIERRLSLLALDGETPIGTASYSKARLPDMAGWGELISIYFLPSYMGKGYGRDLLDAALLELKKLGYKNVYLWVLEENERARRFYEKNGFMRTDIYLSDNIGGRPLREVQYRFFG